MIKNSLLLLNKYTHYCGRFQVFWQCGGRLHSSGITTTTTTIIIIIIIFFFLSSYGLPPSL